MIGRIYPVIEKLKGMFINFITKSYSFDTILIFIKFEDESVLKLKSKYVKYNGFTITKLTKEQVILFNDKKIIQVRVMKNDYSKEIKFKQGICI